MADFVAVIRRTVDGLSDNVPEMRAKVYEKARGAVRRQLENMKPRPSDEMIERQMVKLEAAINEVESDHTEALPSLDEQQQQEFAPETAHGEPADAQPESGAVEETPPVAEPEPEESSEPQPVVGEEPLEELAEPAQTPAEPVAAADALPAPETVLAESVAPETTADEQPVDSETVLQAEPAAEAAAIFPEQAEPEHAVEPAWQQPEPVEQYEAADVPAPDQPVVFEQPDAASVEAVAPDDVHVPEQVEAEPLVEQVEAEDKPAVSEWELPDWSDPVPAAAHDEPVWTQAADVAAITDEIPDLTDYEPVETVTPLHGDAEGKPKDGTEPSHSWAWDDRDPFAQGAAPAATESTEPAISDWSWPVEKQAAAEPEGQKPSGDAWRDIDDLLEQGGTAAAAGAAAGLQQGGGAATGAEEELSAPSRSISYRAEPKRSRFNLKFAGVAAVVLLAAGGAGYAYWQNQNAVNSWIAATVASITAQVPGQASPDESVPEDGAKDVTTPDRSSATQTPPDTDVASLDSATSKFTQRLQADGTEVNQGPAPAPAGEVAGQEGKSVAAQTEAGKPQNAANATPLDGADDAQPAQAVPAQQTATNPATQQTPAGAQKMFLYEERLGQSAPTAIEGNVAWSVKEESPGGDAKPEPVIQAQINVPERGLTALMTIKRNADSSLPASHVVEFVFSLPENFEGGSIESVQRVSMKRNEQDRGDQLIAVPAKITDDFHMIALNDFQEAVATNTELLRSRNWIDIPLTYRNGRRALLTLEKGPAGTEAFSKAMQAWPLAAKPNAAVQ